MDVIVKGSPGIQISLERKVVDSYKEVDSALSETSKNPVENAVITKAIAHLENRIVVLSETEYENLTKKEDKFYFCYEE